MTENMANYNATFKKYVETRKAYMRRQTKENAAAYQEAIKNNNEAASLVFKGV